MEYCTEFQDYLWSRVLGRNATRKVTFLTYLFAGGLVTASDDEREEGLILCKLSVQSSVIGAYGKHEALWCLDRQLLSWEPFTHFPPCSVQYSGSMSTTSIVSLSLLMAKKALSYFLVI